MKTPRTDKLVERLNVEPWLSTETKCRSLHDFAQSLEAENAKLREALEKFRGQFDCYECTGTAEDCLDSLDNTEIAHSEQATND